MIRNLDAAQRHIVFQIDNVAIVMATLIPVTLPVVQKDSYVMLKWLSCILWEWLVFTQDNDVVDFVIAMQW